MISLLLLILLKLNTNLPHQKLQFLSNAKDFDK